MDEENRQLFCACRRIGRKEERECQLSAINSLLNRKRRGQERKKNSNAMSAVRMRFEHGAILNKKKRDRLSLK